MIPITLCTDSDITLPEFDYVLRLTNPSFSFRDKIIGLLTCASEKCLFLDTDTLVCGDVSNVFGLLDRFDIAVAHASWRSSPKLKDGKVIDPAFREAGIPNCFPDLNTGVIAFRNSDKVKRMFTNWLQIYERQSHSSCGIPANDQPAFTEAIWSSDLQLYILPPELNCRVDFPVFVGSDARVCHGRDPLIEEAAHIINSGIGARVFVPSLRKIFDSAHFTFMRKVSRDE